MNFYMALLPFLQITFMYSEHLLQVINNNNNITKAKQFLPLRKDLI